MVGNKRIKVFFIKLYKKNTNTASENRFHCIHEMVNASFETEIIKTKEINKNFHNYRLLRGLCNKLRVLQATIQILRKRSKYDINILYLFGVDPLLSLYYYLYARIFNFILVSERNELPNSIIKGERLKELLERVLIYPWYYKLFDGYTLISDELIKHYSSYVSKKQVIYKLPMTVDFSRFKNVNTDKSLKYVFYAGSLNNSKDGIEFLIKAFLAENNRLKDVFLFIAWNDDSHNREYLINKINCNNIKLLGEVKREDIPQYLMNASVCVLPRPDSLQARGGFPTKLGEYLATGNPVIVSDVGEIPNYLTDTEVFFVSNNNLESDLRKKLLEVFDNYESAIQKGIHGKIKAKEYFSLENNSSIVKEFLLTTVKKKLQ